MRTLPGRASLIWLALIATVAAGAWWSSREPESSTVVPMVPVTRSSLTVHVGGWVAAPGLIELPSGARVADAIAAAGGTLPGAEVDAINLAAALVDGAQVVVPGPEEARGPGRAETGGPIQLNLATAAELDALPGVGPVIAQRIVDYRERNGPFGAVEDLLDVPGIGEAKLANIRDLVAP